MLWKSVALSLALAAPAAAGPLEDGAAAYGHLALMQPLADRGDAHAQFLLGGMYAGGNGVPKNNGQAVRWYRKAADQGDADAQRELGFMYDTGLGVPKDDALAVRWYNKAAGQGDTKAYYSLGIMYAFNQDVDYILAYKWLDLAAAHGDKSIQALRDQIAEHMTPTQIAEAQRLSREWKPAVR